MKILTLPHFCVCVQVLDGGSLRYGVELKVKKAEFSIKGATYDPSKRAKVLRRLTLLTHVFAWTGMLLQKIFRQTQNVRVLKHTPNLWSRSGEHRSAQGRQGGGGPGLDLGRG